MLRMHAHGVAEIDLVDAVAAGVDCEGSVAHFFGFGGWRGWCG